ncbi:MAG: Ig-like domain-containing protein, partial [Gemmatimonadota bacterium]
MRVPSGFPSLTAACLVLIALGSSACSDGSSTEPKPPPDDDLPGVVITTAGGSFTFLNGAVVLDVPAGALTANTRVSVHALNVGPGQERAVPGALFDFRPDGLRFAKPVTVTMRYDRTRVPQGMDVAMLRVHRFVGGEPKLLIGSRLDTVSSMVRAPLEGFSPNGVGEATVPDVFAGIKAMADAAPTADEQALDALRETVRQDATILVPKMDGECTATPVLSLKKSIMNQLVLMQSWLDLLSLDAPVISVDQLCSGILDPSNTEIIIEPTGELRVVPGETAQLSAKMVGPFDQELVGTVRWLSSNAGTASVSAEGLVTGVSIGRTAVTAVSVDMPDINATTTVIVAPDLLV